MACDGAAPFVDETDLLDRSAESGDAAAGIEGGSKAMFSLSAKEAGGARGKGGASLSFIGAEAELTGDIATASHLHIDGTVHGDISCAALIQGRTGTIAGNVSADEVTIAGTVRGVIGAARVTLEATAKII